MSSENHSLRWSLATILLAPRGGQAAPPSPAERKDLYSWAATAGFSGIELSPRWYDFNQMDGNALIGLRTEIEQAGLRVSGINVERAMIVGSALAQSHRDRIRAAINAAAVLRAPLVDIALAMDWDGAAEREVVTSSAFSAFDFAVAAAELKALARHAAGQGIALSVELHDDGLLDDAAGCRRFIESIEEPNVGANPDVGNICRNPVSPGDWEAALLQLAPLANCWHVKNYRGGAPAPLDGGDIDYCRALGIMLDAGFAGWVSIESRSGTFRETQSAAIDYLRKLEQAIHESHRTVLEPIHDA